MARYCHRNFLYSILRQISGLVRVSSRARPKMGLENFALFISTIISPCQIHHGEGLQVQWSAYYYFHRLLISLCVLALDGVLMMQTPPSTLFHSTNPHLIFTYPDIIHFSAHQRLISLIPFIPLYPDRLSPRPPQSISLQQKPEQSAPLWNLGPTIAIFLDGSNFIQTSPSKQIQIFPSVRWSANNIGSNRTDSWNPQNQRSNQLNRSVPCLSYSYVLL